MSKSINISIPQPCHEKWNLMSPTEQGAFCKSCRKNVIDFTGKTEHEVYTILTEATGTVCGRFSNLQLEQPIRKTELQNGWFNWRAIAAGFAAFFSIHKIVQANDLEPQPKVAYMAKTDTAAVIISERKVTQIVSQTLGIVNISPKQEPIMKVLQGRVLDAETKEPVEFVNIYLKQKGTALLPDTNGRFKLMVDLETMREDTLVFKCIGYTTRQIPVRNFQDNMNIELEVNMQFATVGMVVVTQSESKKHREMYLRHRDVQRKETTPPDRERKRKEQ